MFPSSVIYRKNKEKRNSILTHLPIRNGRNIDELSDWPHWKLIQERSHDWMNKVQYRNYYLANIKLPFPVSPISAEIHKMVFGFPHVNNGYFMPGVFESLNISIAKKLWIHVKNVMCVACPFSRVYLVSFFYTFLVTFT